MLIHLRELRADRRQSFDAQDAFAIPQWARDRGTDTDADELPKVIVSSHITIFDPGQTSNEIDSPESPVLLSDAPAFWRTATHAENFEQRLTEVGQPIELGMFENVERGPALERWYSV